MDLPIFFQPAPVKPGYDIILTISVIIAKLCVTKFVSSIKHGRSPAAHQCRKCIFDHSKAQAFDLRIIRLTLCSTVPAISVVISVRIIPAIFFIVLCIIGI